MTGAARIWKLGDDIDTDALAPGRYMNAPINVFTSHCLEVARPEFPAEVKPGDIVVAGANFGMGSSREQAVEALKHLGIAAVIAISFAGIFYRNVGSGPINRVHNGVGLWFTRLQRGGMLNGEFLLVFG